MTLYNFINCQNDKEAISEAYMYRYLKESEISSKITVKEKTYHFVV